MPEGQVLEFSGVTKRFGGVTAVSDFSARVEPGRVTGFLGPNGAGKTTSLRILLGLVRATGGTATIGGSPYEKLAHPLQTVGAVLEASSFHPGRTAANHLRVYARAAKISNERVDDVLGLVGLSDAAGRKVGGFSLGMRQRLGLAYALLGDPGVLVLDEPSNGLDPEGIKWIRGFLRQLAREGRTLLVSSHMLTEVQQTVDALVVISGGRLVFQGGIDELADPSEYATVVDAPDRAALTGALASADVAYEVLRSGVTVRGFAPADVGRVAAEAGVALSSLQRRGPALEEVFLELVNGTRVHPSAAGPLAAAAVVAEEIVPETGADETVAEEAAGEDVEDDEPVSEDPDVEGIVVADGAPSATGAAAGTAAGFAVASTGVIDIISGESAASDAESDAIVDVETPTGAVWVASAAGVTEVVIGEDEVSAEERTADEEAAGVPEDDSGEPGDAEPADDSDDESEPEPEPEPEPEDADVDVEAVGAIDDELTEDLEEDADDDDSDDDADADADADDADADVDADDADDDEEADAEAQSTAAAWEPGGSSEAEPEESRDDEDADGAAEDEASVDGDSARPFDEYEKTESDREADAFFSQFGDGDSDEPEPQAEAESAPEPEESAATDESTDEGAAPEASADDPPPPTGTSAEPDAASDATDRSIDTDEFGALSDLEPGWSESEQGATREGGEQR